jgi:flagellar hook-associated protein 3 FlgL
MRVTFSSAFRNGLRDINQSAEELARRQREVSSLQRMQLPSDDPAAMSAAIGERTEMRVFDQYLRATDSVDSRLNVLDSALSDILRNLTAAQSTAAATRTSFLTQEQREAYALQLGGIRDAILSDLSIEFRDTFVFSGTASDTAPYRKDATGAVQSYAGDHQQMAIDIDRSRSVDVTVDGSAIAQGSDAVDLFEVFDDLIDAVRNGNDSAIDAGMAALDRAFSRTTNVQSQVGNALHTLEDHRLRLGDMRRASDARRSKREDANLAEAISGMQQADAAHQAAIGAVAATSRLSLFDYLK